MTDATAETKAPSLSDTQGKEGAKTAVLYRMSMPKHLCPYGLKTKAFLEKGGYEEVRKYLGQPVREEGSTTYQPVIAVFGMAFLMAVALAFGTLMPILSARALEVFIAFSMCLLALQKLRDIESFSTMFLNYDLLAQRWVWYGYVYPVAEALAGLLMLTALPLLAAPIAIFIGGVGAVSVIKAVYVDKRELKCACMGGSSEVPLGFVSLTENLMMLIAGIWMLF